MDFGTSQNNNVTNKIETKWLRPWNITKFNDLYNRDERFFSILIKGVISYLNSHIILYDKGINHFIFNTGSSYMYVESNGYEFSWNETSGEDTMYMEMPRCVINISNISVPQEELSQSFARGNYERKDGDIIRGYNAEIKRIPIEMHLDLHYVLSNFNESIVLLQELFDKLIFQQYFNISYLGRVIKCSIEFPAEAGIEINKIDMASAEVNQRNINISLVICTNYPLINEHTEIDTRKIISKFMGFVNQEGRDSNVVINIDGVESDVNDIYVDLRPYDFNNDGKINDHELTVLKEFIDTFDMDEDGAVTSHDIDIITEFFAAKEYDVRFDILNIGSYDLRNLVAIKELFKSIDINNDQCIDKREIKEVSEIIMNYLKYDINGDLIIDYRDLNTSISYISNNMNATYDELIQEIYSYINSIPNLNEEFREYVLNIINTDPKNAKAAIEYWLLHHEEVIVPIDVVDKIYKYIDKIVLFISYDFNNDGILDENDMIYASDDISTVSNRKITCYTSSNLYIHMHDHTLSPSSITDTVTYEDLTPKIEE